MLAEWRTQPTTALGTADKKTVEIRYSPDGKALEEEVLDGKQSNGLWRAVIYHRYHFWRRVR